MFASEIISTPSNAYKCGDLILLPMTFQREGTGDDPANVYTVTYASAPQGRNRHERRRNTSPRYKPIKDYMK